MNINLKKNEETAELHVRLTFKGKNGDTKIFTTDDAKNWINVHFPKIDLGNTLVTPDKSLHNLNNLEGKWIFEIKKKNVVDKSINSVKINKTIVGSDVSKTKKNTRRKTASVTSTNKK
jgi:hypothetical protein